jgi:hypothetical protein
VQVLAERSGVGGVDLGEEEEGGQS